MINYMNFRLLNVDVGRDGVALLVQSDVSGRLNNHLEHGKISGIKQFDWLNIGHRAAK